MAKVLILKYLEAFCTVRCWEDAKVNGVEDVNGDLIPCRKGDDWEPIIDLDTGVILNWKSGVEASIYYKVCDDGKYKLLDQNKNQVGNTLDGYVPKIMCPEEDGFGDYIIMEVNGDGKIANWKVGDLAEFQDRQKD